MDFLRKAWGEAFNQAYLWALGFLLFTAIMGTMGWSGTFGEKASSERRRPVSADGTSHAQKKPVTGAFGP